MPQENLTFIRRKKWLLLIPLVMLGILCLFAGKIYFSTAKESFIDTSSLPSTLIDMHIHTAGLGFKGSGCFISEKMQHSYKFSIYLDAFETSVSDLKHHGDAIVIQKLAQQISNAKYVTHGVVLALDGVMTEEGILDRQNTQVYIPNSFVGRELRNYPQLLFGASINPYRQDWREQLQEAVDHQAKLIKWIPSIQWIDPADPKIIPFYKELIRHQLPLLSHTGAENAFDRAKNELADPMRLQLPLTLGVTVIAAHVATTGMNEGEPDIQRLLRIVNRYPNIYADISSLTQINKFFFWDQVFGFEPLKERLIYGSDFPLNNTILVSPLHRFFRIPSGQIKTILNEPNPFDRDILYKLAMKIPPKIFTQTSRLISIENRAPINNMTQ